MKTIVRIIERLLRITGHVPERHGRTRTYRGRFIDWKISL